jgi:hypothetical protein
MGKIIEVGNLQAYISANQRDEAGSTSPVVEPPPSPPEATPTPTPTPNPATDGIGTEAQPYLLNKALAALAAYGRDKHYPENGGEFGVGSSNTIWLLADPASITGLKTPNMIAFTFCDYAAYQIRYSGQIWAVNKNSKLKRLMGSIPGGQTGFHVWSHNPNEYYLISIAGKQSAEISIYWKPL